MGLEDTFLENEPLMEVDDNGTLEPYDYDDNSPVLANCDYCGKIEEFHQFDERNERGSLTDMYYCDECEDHLEKVKYFFWLSSKGLLETYGSWIVRVYPEYKKYVHMCFDESVNWVLARYKEYVEGEEERKILSSEKVFK